MRNEEFMQEGMDIKRLFLCMVNKAWLLLLLTICGVLAGSGTYLLVRSVNMPVEYRAESQIYLQFIFDPGDQVEQSYNAYTWNMLVHTDPIMDRIMFALDGEGLTWEEVSDAIKAEILSDRRLLIITITADNSEKADAIQKAAEKGLAAYGSDSREIISLEVIRTIPPEKSVWDDRTMRAAIGGGVLFFIVTLLVLLVYYILDDSLYVIADGEKRFPYPVLGLLVKMTGSTGQDKAKGDQLYADELAENMSYLLGDMHKLALLPVDKEEHALYAREVFERISAERIPDKSWEVQALEPAADNSRVVRMIREMDGAVLVIPFGRRNGKKIEKTISFLHNQDCKIQGILITEGSEKFWKCYYAGKDEKKI